MIFAGFAQGQEDATQIDGMDPVPFGTREVHDGPRGAHTGVEEGPVQSSEAFGCGGHGVDHVRFAGHVALDVLGRHAGGGLDEVQDGDPSARLHQSLHNGASDAR